MAEISVPGDVTLQVGETLTIHWSKSCKFCVKANTGVTFVDLQGSPLPMPIGGSPSGPAWVGKAVTAGEIRFHHVDADGDCDGIQTGSGGRTIVVTAG
jgi:hypothetical protein